MLLITDNYRQLLAITTYYVIMPTLVLGVLIDTYFLIRQWKNDIKGEKCLCICVHSSYVFRDNWN